MSTLQLKETKVPSVQFVGDDDVLSHILDREGGMHDCTVEEMLMDHVVLKNIITRAGEMAQWVRAPDCSSEGPKFKSQQPHGGSQPSVT
jgi:hypothetical protein